jgi:hypothetical protein
VSLGECTGGDLWGGPPVVTDLGFAVSRCRVVATGTIVPVPASAAGHPSSYRCTLFDGTGQIDLLFLGRPQVRGMTLGARCRVEGTARMDHGRLTLWNPLYDLEPLGSDGDWPPRSAHG